MWWRLLVRWADSQGIRLAESVGGWLWATDPVFSFTIHLFDSHNEAKDP